MASVTIGTQPSKQTNMFRTLSKPRTIEHLVRAECVNAVRVAEGIELTLRPEHPESYNAPEEFKTLFSTNNENAFKRLVGIAIECDMRTISVKGNYPHIWVKNDNGTSYRLACDDEILQEEFLDRFTNELKGQCQTWYIREHEAGYYCNGVVRSC